MVVIVEFPEKRLNFLLYHIEIIYDKQTVFKIIAQGILFVKKP